MGETMHSELVEQMAARLKEAGLLPLQKQAELSTRILQERLAVVLPWAMEAADVDFWLVVARENNLDPVLKTLYPWDMPEARRLGVLAFHRDKGTGKIRKMLL